MDLAAFDRALVVAAHPDDEVLGCGATIARLADQGCVVDVLILAEGVTSRYPAGTPAPAAELEALHAQAQAAGRVLGAQSVTVAGFPDNRMDSVALLDVVQRVEQAVVASRPQLVLTHHGGDLNIDHQVVHQAVLTATRPTGPQAPAAVMLFEVPSSTEWAFSRFAPAFRPQVFIDVAASIDRKVEAMAIYDGESRPFPHPRSAGALTALAQTRGSAAGVLAAEAFEVARLRW
jgi:LmbE family N-acetylglucosaminyl deacetylase